jgi:hypothetical protein
MESLMQLKGEPVGWIIKKNTAAKLAVPFSVRLSAIVYQLGREAQSGEHTYFYFGGDAGT